MVSGRIAELLSEALQGAGHHLLACLFPVGFDDAFLEHMKKVCAVIVERLGGTTIKFCVPLCDVSKILFAEMHFWEEERAVVGALRKSAQHFHGSTEGIGQGSIEVSTEYLSVIKQAGVEPSVKPRACEGGRFHSVRPIPCLLSRPLQRRRDLAVGLVGLGVQG